MADFCDHGNKALFPYQEEIFSSPLATTIFQEDTRSMSKLAVLDEASYISPWAAGHLYVFSKGPKKKACGAHPPF